MKKVLVLLASLALALSAQAQELSNFAMWGQKPIISPEIQNDSVTFRLKADYATVVKLNGSWMENPWFGTIDMKRGENCVWEVKIPLPEPEIYTYSFIVDGVAVNDPQNVLVQRDGTRYLPMLIVPGERTENYVEATKHGTVSHPWYTSKILGMDRRLTVYTPYGYENNPKKKYPVLYLLHGAGGDEEAWTSMGRTAQILDNLRMTEMIRISRTKFYYKVKGLTGENPSVFFKRYKLNRAAELLKEGRHNMSEIAYMTGFNTLSHFSTSFKKQFGVSPSDYSG